MAKVDAIVDYKLDDDIFKNDTQYFFTLFSGRFELTNDIFRKLLENRFNKKFKPIHILRAPYNNFFRKNNYILINKKLIKMKNKLGIDKLVFLQEYEELNEEFSESKFIKGLIEKLSKKQEKIFLTSFTTAFLKLKHPKLVVIGPDSKLATKYDNKIEQAILFKKLGLPHPKTRIYRNFAALRKSAGKYLPFFISSSYTSGGCESAFIRKIDELDSFYKKLRKVNKLNGFFIADFIEDVKLSPAALGIVFGRDKTKTLFITDQLLEKNKYLGNIYPSRANRKECYYIIRHMKKIGDYLSRLGYKGLFGCDFLIDSKGKCLVVDINPRRIGGYLIYCLLAKRVSIVDLELRLALDEKIPEFDYEDFQVNFVWAHSKVKIHDHLQKVVKEVKENDEKLPFVKIGGEFKAIFYPKSFTVFDGNIGYYITSGKRYDKVLHKVKRVTEEILREAVK